MIAANQLTPKSKGMQIFLYVFLSDMLMNLAGFHVNVTAEMT